MLLQNTAGRGGPDFLLPMAAFSSLFSLCQIFLLFFFFSAELPNSQLILNAGVSMREETGQEQAGGVQCEPDGLFSALSYTSIKVNMELLQAQALLAVSLCS